MYTLFPLPLKAWISPLHGEGQSGCRPSFFLVVYSAAFSGMPLEVNCLFSISAHRLFPPLSSPLPPKSEEVFALSRDLCFVPPFRRLFRPKLQTHAPPPYSPFGEYPIARSFWNANDKSQEVFSLKSPRPSSGTY